MFQFHAIRKSTDQLESCVCNISSVKYTLSAALFYFNCYNYVTHYVWVAWVWFRRLSMYTQCRPNIEGLWKRECTVSALFSFYLNLLHVKSAWLVSYLQTAVLVTTMLFQKSKSRLRITTMNYALLYLRSKLLVTCYWHSAVPLLIMVNVDFQTVIYCDVFGISKI